MIGTQKVHIRLSFVDYFIFFPVLVHLISFIIGHIWYMQSVINKRLLTILNRNMHRCACGAYRCDASVFGFRTIDLVFFLNWQRFLLYIHNSSLSQEKKTTKNTSVRVNAWLSERTNTLNMLHVWSDCEQKKIDSINSWHVFIFP